MEYKNNWPTYLQERVKPVKGVAEAMVSSEVCVGVKPTNELDGFFAVVSAKVDEVRKRKLAVRQLPLDSILQQLIKFQSSKDVSFSGRAKKASIELAKERSRLSCLKEKLMYEARRGRMTREVVKAKMKTENRKAISTFLLRWESLFEVVR